jgi:uncharacterized protein
MIIGRKNEFEQLENSYELKKSNLIAIYGRRRVGKSFLIKAFGARKKMWAFEGLESEPTSEQIRHFTSQLQSFTKDSFLEQTEFKNWTQVFRYMTDRLALQKNKTVLFFDEFQWMAANQSSLVSLIKFFWDNHWKNLNVQLILCGSIASFMIEKVIKSKALYGRIDIELRIDELKPTENKLFFNSKRSLNEILLYNLIIGGIPKYFDVINVKESFEKNIERLAFSKSGYLFNDFEKIFYGQFKEYRTYEKIIKFISERPHDLDSISKHLKIPSGGGLARYLKNMESARFIKSYTPIQKTKSNVIKYRIFDEYLIFYFKFIQPHRKNILNDIKRNIFSKSVKPIWSPWLGFAFENFCSKYPESIFKALKITDLIDDFGPYFERKDSAGFQIDLLIKRTDKTWTVCECKYNEKPLSIKVVKDMQKKISLLHVPKGISIETALITVNGVDSSVKDLGYFNSILTIEDLYDS